MRNHPEYKFDSEVSERVTYDLIKVVEEITRKEGRGRPTGGGKEGRGKGRGVGWEMLRWE